MLLDLDKVDISKLKGIGQKKKLAFLKLNINTVADLLLYYPRTYQDRRDIKPIFHLADKKIQTIKGKIIGYKKEKFVKKGIDVLKAIVFDGSGYLYLYFFKKEILNFLPINSEIIVSGKVEYTEEGIRMTKFDYELISQGDGFKDEFIHTNRIVPIYSLSEKLIRLGGQRFLRRVIKSALDEYSHKIKEYLPKEILIKNNLCDINFAIYNIHFPSDYQAYKKAKERLIFDEFFFIQLGFCILNRKLNKFKGISFKAQAYCPKIIDKFLNNLPFELTKDQIQVIEKIKQKMYNSKPMRVLLHGEVASGKTVLASYAGVLAIACGYQVVFMCPTEVLAYQHFINIKNLYKDLGINVELLIGSLYKKQKISIIEGLKSGKINMLIATHAVLQEDIEFHRLGLCIIDEQQRFGVEQRTLLYKKGIVKNGSMPDLLVMTATPIPRTLALTVYADLDILTLPPLPRPNQKIITVARPQRSLNKIYEFIKDKITMHSQAYIIYPVVEESKQGLKACKQDFFYLKNEVFKEFKVGLLYGSMPQKEQKKIIEEFANKNIDILLTTTVSEVGLDIKSANIMVIMHAERFGLSQLHQLRGRISRSEGKAYCIAIIPDNLWDIINQDINIDEVDLADETLLIQAKRIKSFIKYNSGFKLAEIDLELRGPGEFIGTRQHGLPELKLANIIKDQELLKKARISAEILLSKSPTLSDFLLLKEIAKRRLKDKIEFLIS